MNNKPKAGGTASHAEAELKYRALFDQSPDGILILDQEGHILDFNTSAHQQLGYTREEFSKLRIADIDPVETSDEIKAKIGEMLQLGKAEHDVKHKTKQGEIRDVHVIVQKIVLSGKSVLHAIWRDITQYKQAEEAIKAAAAAAWEEKSKTEAIIAAMGDAVNIQDTRYKILYQNEVSIGIYGSHVGEYCYKTFQHKDQVCGRCHLTMAFADGKIHRMEQSRTTDSGMRYYDITASPVRDAAGTIIAGIEIIRDVTERKQAEEALRESEMRYRILFDQSPDGILLIDTQGAMAEFNEAAHAMLGYSRAEFATIRISDINLDSAEKTQACINRLLNDGKVEFAVKYRAKDGGIRDIQVISRVLVLGGRKLFHSIWHDITEQKNLMNMLGEKTAEQNAILENALVGIAYLRDRRFIWINEKMEHMFGYTRGEVAGQLTALFYPSQESYEELGREAYPLLATGKTYDTERVMKRKDGALFWCSLSGKSIDPAVTAKGAIWILQDITQRKNSEDKIRQSEEFIRNILDTVDEGFIVINRDYRILTANKAYANQVGRGNEEIIGRHCYEVSHRIDRPCYEEGEDCAPRRAFETGKLHSALHRHKEANGNILYVETKAFPIQDESGNVTSVIETINNITERYLLEEERLKTQKLESIGTLAGGIAHDFNNLLQGIFGYIAMAKMTFYQKEKSLAMLEQAEKALHQSVHLTTQLLTFSKGGKPVKKLIDLRPVIENSTKFSLSGSRSDFRISIPEDLWQAEADEGQVGQVIQNIVLNADQAMPVGGTVTVTAVNMAKGDASLPPALEKGDYVTIVVQDTGIGIPEPYLARIFDPYFTTKEKGSGLGLATSYSIIKNHGGMIDVKTKSGAGTTFTIYLPAIVGEVQATSAVSSSIRPLVQRSAKVLVMDDEDYIRNLTRELLSALGHNVEVAQDGEEALEKYQGAMVKGKPFDIVILDMTVRGGMGGIETIRQLLTMDAQVKAVMSSGYSDDEAITNYLSLGFKASLKKPYDVNALRDIIINTLNS